jgi:hypothetical protein
MPSCLGALLLAALALAAAAQPALAVAPGQNGPIVFQAGVGQQGCCTTIWKTYIMGPNGEGPAPLVDGSNPVPHPGGKAIAVQRNGSSARDLYDLQGNLVQGIGTDLIGDFSPDGKSAAVIHNGEVAIQDVATGTVRSLGVEGFDVPQFTPDGSKIIFKDDYIKETVAYEGIFKINVDGTGLTQLYEAGTLGAGLSVAPNGINVAFAYQNNVWVMGLDGSGAHPITSAPAGAFYSAPSYSPDGSKIVVEKRMSGPEEGIYLMDIAGGGERKLYSESDYGSPLSLWKPRWLAAPSTISLKLEARRVADGDDVFDVVMRLKAGNQSAVENLRFTDPEIIASSAAGFPEEERSEVVKLSGPDQPIPARLEVNEERTLVWTYRVTKPGRVALFSEVTARAVDDGVDETDGASVIADSIPTEAPEPDTDGEITPQLAVLGAMDHWLLEAYKAYLSGNEEIARKIVRYAKKHLSPKERKVWLGAKNEIKVSPAEQAFADRANLSPELAGAMLPDTKKARQLGLVKPSQAPSDAEVLLAFYEGYEHGMNSQAKADLGKAWKGVKKGFVNTIAVLGYLAGSASPEERAQVEAMAANTWTLAEGKAEIDWDSAEGKHVLARYGGSLYRDHIGIELPTIRAEDVEAIWNDITLQTEDLQRQLRQEKIKLKNIYNSSDILESARRHGEMISEQAYPWAKIGAETMVGGGIAKVGEKAVTKIPGLIRLGEAEGELNAAGKAVKNPEIDIAHDAIGSTGARPSIRDTILSRRTFGSGETLDELESIGGIPTREADIQRQIVGEIEQELGLPEGQIGLALKPSSALRKENSVAKFELCKAKTGKPVHEQLGMDPEALSEPNFFKPTNPKQLPEWEQISVAEQDDLLNTYKKAKKEYADWTSGNPRDPDLAKLSKATQRVGGPEITKPVTVDLGQGRQVKAIFEEVPVPGTDTIRIRVKYYETDGIVFVDSKVARPMGPDLDAVAIYDAKAGARFADRQLETKIVRAYRKKIAERVQAGERFHGAEHGLTLIMDDVGAGPNGSVGFLMQYGIPYLPEPAAYEFAKRIEPFVEMLAEEIMGNVGKPNSGAFGQKLVNVTSTDVYYGTLPVDSW